MNHPLQPRWHQRLAGRYSLFPAWLGVLVLSFAWLRALPIFVPTSGGFGAWITAGTLLLIIGCNAANLGPRVLTFARAVPLGIAALVGLLVLPSPFGAGLWLLLAAVALGLLPANGLSRRLLPGLWAAGVILVLQAGLIPILYIFGSRLHNAPFLTPFVYWPLKLLAWDTLRTGAIIHLASPVDFAALTPSWEKLGLFPGALAAAGFATLLMLHEPGRMRRAAGLAIVCALYAWLRIVVLFLVVSRFRDANFFWNFGPLFLSFVPLTILLGVWWSAGSGRLEGPAPAPALGGRNPGRWRVALGAFLTVAGFTLLWGYHDPGERKQGRVLIDESHSNWEWTTQIFDKAWYGGKSGYNYYCLADYWSHFYHVETHTEPLTRELLSRWDVLVIKAPTSAYSPAEVAVVVDFVRAGGGLLLVGDHTNVFGSSTYLNPFAERFGAYFRYDATYALENLALSIYRRPAILPHPVVRHLPDFLFATSCSLEAPLLSENVILGDGLRAMFLDYSETSFFPTKRDKLDYQFGLLPQSAGARYGKGRVLLFTDSTVFSNFFMFIPGKPELALGFIDWLNRRNRRGFLYPLFLTMGVAGLVLLAGGMRGGSRVDGVQTFVVVGLLTFVATAKACDRADTLAYPLPQPQRPLQEVVFDAEHGDFLLPTRDLVYGNWNAVQTFYVWTQRLGLTPRVADKLQEALARPGRALVELNPSTPYSVAEIDGVVDFVRHGGNLIVIDDPTNSESSANQILGAFELAFTGQVRESVAVMRPAGVAGQWLAVPLPGDTLAIAPKARAISGVRPLLVLPDNSVVMGYLDFGRGKVVVVGAGRLLSDEMMGTTATEPTPSQRALYQVEFDLFEGIAGITVHERYATRPFSETPAIVR